MSIYKQIKSTGDDYEWSSGNSFLDFLIWFGTWIIAIIIFVSIAILPVLIITNIVSNPLLGIILITPFFVLAYKLMKKFLKKVYGR